MAQTPPKIRVRIPSVDRGIDDLPPGVLSVLPGAGVPHDELKPILLRDKCFRNTLTKFRQAESMTVPSGEEIERQWRKVEIEYKRWLLLRTGKDHRQQRINEILCKLQDRATILRRAEVMRRLKAVRFRAHSQVPHIEIRIPGVSD
jgi:hypothetical protein